VEAGAEVSQSFGDDAETYAGFKQEGGAGSNLRQGINGGLLAPRAG
jgi:hypothetical protein